MLNSRLPVIRSNRYSTSLSLVDDKTCGSLSLFHVSNLNKPGESDKPVAMFADELVTLHYKATRPGNQICNVYVEARFEAGKSYSLYGGDNVPTGFSGLFNKGTCSFGIVDESSNQAMPLAKVKSVCAK